MNRYFFCILTLAALILSGCGCYKPYYAGKGQTVGGVARLHGMSEAELRQMNGLRPGERLREGDKLFLPCEAREDWSRITGKKAAPTVASRPKPKARPRSKPAPSAKAGSRQRFDWPVRGEVVRGFSKSANDATRGIDIRVPPGAQVVAAGGGRVEYAGTPVDAYGPMVLLDHGDGFYTVYSHLGRLFVSTGARVKAGTRLADAGKGSYVHFEVRKGRNPVDPLLYLPRR